jgi:hypothetical protein
LRGSLEASGRRQLFATTLQVRLTDAAGGNERSIGPCTIANGLAAGWAGVGVRGNNPRGEWDDVVLTTP